jgi:hypothetical protein
VNLSLPELLQSHRDYVASRETVTMRNDAIIADYKSGISFMGVQVDLLSLGRPPASAEIALHIPAECPLSCLLFRLAIRLCSFAPL